MTDGFDGSRLTHGTYESVVPGLALARKVFAAVRNDDDTPTSPGTPDRRPDGGTPDSHSDTASGSDSA
jgi:hypothetical protein